MRSRDSHSERSPAYSQASVGVREQEQEKTLPDSPMPYSEAIRSGSIHDDASTWEGRQAQTYSRNITEVRSDFRPSVALNEEEEANIEEALKNITHSFSAIHQRLLSLAIGECTLNQHLAIKLPSREPLSKNHMDAMMAMVEMEFLESLKKEVDHPDEKDVSNPLPFDVFLMEPSLFRPSTDLRQQLALLVPTKKKRGEVNKKKFKWYDGRGTLWDLEPKCHLRKVSSLSGTARILEALMHPPTPLMHISMARDMIVDCNDEPIIISLQNKLNDSQLQAVSIVSSPNFTDGLFCVLGRLRYTLVYACVRPFFSLTHIPLSILS